MENEPRIKTCIECNHKFVTVHPRQRLCDDCRKKHKAWQGKLDAARRKERRQYVIDCESNFDDIYNRNRSQYAVKSNRSEIYEINRKAEALGMNYGEYVSKYGL